MFNDLSHRAQNIRYTSDRTLGKKPKVQRGMRWIQRNGFSYVFLLGILPVGPFVAVNVAAGLARMNLMSYLMAVTLGKGHYGVLCLLHRCQPVRFYCGTF